LAALDSVVSYTLIKGHEPSRPLLLVRTVEGPATKGLLLLEMDGLFPLACASDFQGLKPTLRYFPDSHLLIQRNAADVELLRQLDLSGSRFITDAPPTRGEAWRELRRLNPSRWYTNDRTGKEAPLTSIAAKLTEASDEADVVWKALKIDRPSIPTDRNSELERVLTLAASLALGTISWELWRHRETSTPILALERFGDLEARVRFTAAAIQVHLPLGQRQRDLSEHGLLSDVHAVPWLKGRRVEFSRG
jgi:hypothetical protein